MTPNPPLIWTIAVWILCLLCIVTCTKMPSLVFIRREMFQQMTRLRQLTEEEEEMWTLTYALRPQRQSQTCGHPFWQPRKWDPNLSILKLWIRQNRKDRIGWTLLRDPQVKGTSSIVEERLKLFLIPSWRHSLTAKRTTDSQKESTLGSLISRIFSKSSTIK